MDIIHLNLLKKNCVDTLKRIAVKFFIIISIYLILLAPPVDARHHVKGQKTLSEKAQNYKIATRAYRAGEYATTLMYLRPLAEQHYMKAQGTLGWMYESGRGLRRDYVMAFVWYDLAVENGHKKAHRNRNLVEAKLSDKELKKALSLAKKCLKVPTSCPKYSE